MKGNDGTGNVIERDDWETPMKIFNILNKQYSFKLDCCAILRNSKCPLHSNDFLKETKIDYLSWMNPPFSKATDMFEHFFKVVKRGVCIYRCDNIETKIWQDIILKNANWIFIPKGRISYEGKAGKGSRFPSALIGFNVPVPNGLDGATLNLNKENSVPEKHVQNTNSFLNLPSKEKSK